MSHCLCWMEDVKMQIECLLNTSFSSSHTHCLRWWEKHTHRWNGHPSWRSVPNQRKVSAVTLLSSFIHPHVGKPKKESFRWISRLLFYIQWPKFPKHHKGVIKLVGMTHALYSCCLVTCNCQSLLYCWHK